MMMRIWTLGILGVALAGCGGVGVGTSGPGNAVLRNVDGDSYTYTVAGNDTPAGGSATSTSGTATDVYAADTYNSTSALQGVWTTMISVQSGTQTVVDTRQYDANSYVTLAQTDLGTNNNGALQQVTSGAFTPPGTLTSATSINTTEILADGTQVSIIYDVTGSENVTALNGTSYPCWIIYRHVAWSDGLTSVATIDFAPAIGAAVKVVETDNFASGASSVLTSTLNAVHFGIRPQSH
jgi:hypothetical protein